MMRERRHCARWQINRQAKVRLEGTEEFVDCQVKDIGFKGLQMVLGLKLPQESFLKLSVILSEEFTLDIEAGVVWQRSIAGLINFYGLYFTKIKDQDKEKIYKFVYKHFPLQITKRWWQAVGEESEII